MNYNWTEIFKNKSDKELFYIFSGQSLLDKEASDFAELELRRRDFDLKGIDKYNAKWKLEKEKEQYVNSKKPYWYKIVMIFSILPILQWPLFFLASAIFILEGITNMKIAYLAFIAFNSLPLVFIALLIISSKIYDRHKILSILFLIIPFLSFCMIWLFLKS